MREDVSSEHADIASLKQGIEHEINRIDRKIIYITKLKDEAVANLMQRRQECHEKEELGGIDEELEMIQERHTSVVKRQTRIHEARAQYLEIEQALTEINKELIDIQQRHSQVMQQLSEKKHFLEERLTSIEELDNMQVQLDESLKQSNEAFEDEMDRLKREREELLQRTDLSPSEMEAALRAIDEGIEKLETDHALSINKISQASGEIAAQLAKTLSVKAREQEIRAELEKLRAQALNATPSEMAVIEARIAELEKELKQLEMMAELQDKSPQERLEEELEALGLKLTPSGNILTGSGRIMTQEEARKLGLLDGAEYLLAALDARANLAGLLEQRGLTLTPSGRVQTEEGCIYTMEEARKLGLLRGLDEELMQMRGISLTPSGRILTKDGKVLTRKEAERLGLLEGINLDVLFAAEAESESVSESTASSLSGLSSTDVHYLKNVLGRPLTLALAEIAAKQPKDPIHYLGHWLYKYRYNQELDEMKKRELEELLEERTRLAKEMLRQEAEFEAKKILLEIIERVEDAHARETMEQEQENAAIIDAEEAELESEARDTLGTYDGPTRGQQLK